MFESIRSRVLTTAAVATCILASGSVFAQAPTGQISGRVTDASGGVLPGVTITVTQTDTGLVRTTVTNETGAYTVPSLPVGPYRVEAALPGFRYGFLGVADSPVTFGAFLLLGLNIALGAACYALLRSGWKIKS